MASKPIYYLDYNEETIKSPPLHKLKVYTKFDGEVYKKESDGTEIRLMPLLPPVRTSSSVPLDTKSRHTIVDASGGQVSLTLPVGVIGMEYTVKKVDSSNNPVTIEANGAEVIDGDGALVMTTQYAAVKILFDGIKWNITSLYGELDGYSLLENGDYLLNEDGVSRVII